MKRELLKLIECKKCNCEFNLKVFKNEQEVKDGLLVCPRCKNYYFVVEFIPRILSKELYKNNLFEKKYEKEIKKNIPEFKLKEEEDKLSELKKDNIKFFGYEWVHFNRHGFDDHIYNERFEEKIFHEKTLLKKKEIKNKLVLDAGCGNGRYTYQAAKCGAKIVGFDLGPGVESAYQNTKDFPNVHIIQADIFNLPFKKEVFDVVFTIGVIHHTGNSKKAFQSVIKPLRKDGTIAVTCYHKGNFLWEFNDWWIRKITTKMSIPKLIKLSKFLANSCKFCGLAIEKPVNLLFRWEPNVSIMYDWYSAPIAHHHNYPEIYSWCKRLGVNVTEDLRWEKRERIRNIKLIREYIAPDWAITIKGIKQNSHIKKLNPTHIWDKTKINWKS
jgi:SAM-dependent methyltransferase/uncharacterized protein YbaR (Trm112 family)